jgi:hypothetical protein
MIKLYCILCSLIVATTASHSQSNIYDELDKYDVNKIIYNTEILDTAAMEMISDSITAVAIKYKIKMYRSLYNIDSIFDSSDKMKRFVSNPYILEYPKFESYQYRPIYTFCNIFATEYSNGKRIYQRSFFELEKRDRFIRIGDQTKGIKPDTILEFNEFSTLSTVICGKYDVNYAIFYNSSTKDFFIMGGCLPLSPIPESRPLIKFPEKPWHLSRDRTSFGGCVLYAQTRMINQLPKIHSYTEMVTFSLQSTVKKVGSLNLGKLPYSYRLYLIVPNMFCYFDENCNPEDLWLISTYMPNPDATIREYSHGSPSSELIGWEEWGPVEAINFVKLTGSNKSELEKCPGYKPGFKYYERYRRIINDPQSVWDTMINVRGITESELTELRKIERLNVLLPKK